MNTVKKWFVDRPSEVVWLILLSLIFLAIRLYNLKALPIFLDESLNTLWALEVAKSGDWLATDGARLLHIWVLRLLLPATSDILWTGRVVSALMSLLAATGCYLVGKTLFDRLVGLVTFGLYTFSPFTLSNDRLMLSDAYQVAWATLAVWLSLKLVKTQPRWRDSLALGLVLGLFILTNLRGILIWGVPILATLLFGQTQWRNLPKYIGAAYAVAILVATPVWWILRTGVTASQGVSLFGNPLPTWVEYWGRNTGLLVSWLWAYLTPGLMIALLIAVIFMLWQRPREAIFLLGWALAFMIPYVLVAEQWYPRYTLSAYPALFILLAYLLTTVWRWLLALPENQRSIGLAGGIAGLILLFVPALQFIYWQLHDPTLAPYPEADRRQYVEGWTSGYGVSEVVASLQDQVKDKGEIFVAVDHDISKLFGELAFDTWRDGDTFIHILDLKTRDTSTEAISHQVSASPLPVYWVAGDENSPTHLDQAALAVVQVEPIASFARPGNKSHLYVYQLLPKD